MTSYPTSVLVVAGAAFLLVVGVLFALIGALFGVFAGLVVGGLGGGIDAEGSGAPIAGAVGGMAVVVGLAVLAWGIVQVVAGAGMLAHRRWGRVLGLIVGVVGLGFYGLALANGLAAGTVDLLNVAVVAGYALVALGLAVGAAHFREA